MACTIEIVENAPTAYPTITDTITEPATGYFNAVWQRIEAWIAYRWGARTVTFIVEGPGDWPSPLEPFTMSMSEIWRDNAWTSVTLDPTPLGGMKLGELGPYRFIGSLGSTDSPPDAVAEAFRRLASFLNFSGADGGAALISSEEIEGVGRVEYGSPNAAARALQYSGAADLLRAWRKLGVN